MKNLQPLFLFVVMITAGCQSTRMVKKTGTDDKSLYQASIENAMSPAASKICKDLVAISPQNKELSRKNIKGEDYILVVTWK